MIRVTSRHILLPTPNSLSLPFGSSPLFNILIMQYGLFCINKGRFCGRRGWTWWAQGRLEGAPVLQQTALSGLPAPLVPCSSLCKVHIWCLQGTITLQATDLHAPNCHPLSRCHFLCATQILFLEGQRKFSCLTAYPQLLNWVSWLFKICSRGSKLMFIIRCVGEDVRVHSNLCFWCLNFIFFLNA